MSITGTIASTTESSSYTYDLQGRLTTSNQTTNGASAQRRFAYDRWGNRTAAWDATSGGNQIQSVTIDQTDSVENNRVEMVSGKAYSYDAAGNLTSDGTHTYTYDSENRLVAVDGTVGQYSYDHKNRRTNDKHKFTSYERDFESGTDYAVNRQYGQGLGRLGITIIHFCDTGWLS